MTAPPQGAGQGAWFVLKQFINFSGRDDNFKSHEH